MHQRGTNRRAGPRVPPKGNPYRKATNVLCTVYLLSLFNLREKRYPTKGRWVPCLFLYSILDHFIDLIADFEDGGFFAGAGVEGECLTEDIFDGSDNLLLAIETLAELHSPHILEGVVKDNYAQ